MTHTRFPSQVNQKRTRFGKTSFTDVPIFMEFGTQNTGDSYNHHHIGLWGHPCPPPLVCRRHSLHSYCQRLVQKSPIGRYQQLTRQLQIPRRRHPPDFCLSTRSKGAQSLSGGIFHCHRRMNCSVTNFQTAKLIRFKVGITEK